MGQGPYGPRPIWARAHMGQGPYGPRAPGPRALPCWANTSPENAPKKNDKIMLFFDDFKQLKRCATSVRSFWRRYRAEISVMCQKTKVSVFAKNNLVFFLKPGCCGVPIPAGAFFSPKKHAPGCFQRQSSVSRRRNPSLAHTAGSTGSTGSAGLVSSSAAQTLPSTRAGGQDDGSYNKLPQNIFAIRTAYRISCLRTKIWCAKDEEHKQTSMPKEQVC